MKFSFLKVHGSENEFFIIDETKLVKNLTSQEIDDLRKNLCDRKTGVLNGADGLLLVEQPSRSCDTLAKMRVINSDGSEASMCGNGLRTVARYLSEKTGKSEFQVETMHADLKVRQAKDLAENVCAYQVEISPVRFNAATIPMEIDNKTMLINEKIPQLSDKLSFSVVAVPNPHLIAFVNKEQMDGDEQARISKLVNQANPWFPDGINVSFVQVLGDHQIFVRTYERGVGFTNACGTAMCASSLMYVLLENGQFFKEITVTNPGGQVKTVVHQDPDGNYWMELIGNATVTYELQADLKELLNGETTGIQITKTNEQQAYEAFLETI